MAGFFLGCWPNGPGGGGVWGDLKGAPFAEMHVQFGRFGATSSVGYWGSTKLALVARTGIAIVTGPIRRK
jgi:hypothetical protein